MQEANAGSDVPNTVHEDYRELLERDDIDVVSIGAVDHWHSRIAIDAMKAGKHVYCEKPLAMNARETKEMAQAARKAGVVGFVGFNYPHAPVHALAREIIAAGEIGELVSMRLSKTSDSLADPKAPFVWRCDRAFAGTGTIGVTVQTPQGTSNQRNFQYSPTGPVPIAFQLARTSSVSDPTAAVISSS